MNSAIEANIEMSTPEKAHRLAAVADVLRANNMPQETINMILAARCGLPVEKVDTRSPCYTWAEEPEAAKEAAITDVASKNADICTLAWDIVGTLCNMQLVEGLSVLSMAANNFAGPHGYAARVVINENVEVAGAVMDKVTTVPLSENEKQLPLVTPDSLKAIAHTLREEGLSKCGIHAALLSVCGVKITASDLRYVQTTGQSW